MGNGKVKVTEQIVQIPTYPVGNPDKNPMFYEKRVYQGSSGKVYPYSVIDKIYDEKVTKEYHAIILENDYLKVMVLPELGGRIQRAYDKIRQRDFVYYNQVIKPALVGLCGPWISGGIEFNWPQHHRPSTFLPVSHEIREQKDGSITVWVGEIEYMSRMKGMLGVTLYPENAYIELQVKLYNRTDQPQTFLWWANPAVAVNEDTQSIFPSDVTAVYDHGRRDVSSFPIATGTYYKCDYSKGVDLSRYKNIPVPTSYMACQSKYDFVGGYDYKDRAGILHVADHHIAPGKKQWTWGCGEFGKAWDRNLTDEDGPYVELMTGCYTDNQPDFSWMAPYEEKTFVQYFMPYAGLGPVMNATKDCMLNLTVTELKITVSVYATSRMNHVEVILLGEGNRISSRVCDLSPENEVVVETENSNHLTEMQVKVAIFDQEGKEILSYQKEAVENQLPEPAKPAPVPKKLKTTQELYLYGLHIEKYRHATRNPAEYYEEGLRRDPTDIRLNTAYGRLLLSKGQFVQARDHFQKAVKKQQQLDSNPYDGEPFYYLGVSYRYLNELSAAYDAFYKATWNNAIKSAAYYQLACIDSIQGEYGKAMDHVNSSIRSNWTNHKARNLAIRVLRKLNRLEEAKALVSEEEAMEPLDDTGMFDQYFTMEQINQRKEAGEALQKANAILLGDHNRYLETALDFMESGFYEEAVFVLEQDSKEGYPMTDYYLAYCKGKLGEMQEEENDLKQAAMDDTDYCFPHRLEDILVLEWALKKNPEDANGYYYLGNLWYDKMQYDQAIQCFEKSRALYAEFSIVHRNLAIAYYNKKKDPQAALHSMETAFSKNPKDARLLMELNQLYKKVQVPPKRRLEVLEEHQDLVMERDDLYLEWITIKSMLGNAEEAYQLLMEHKFHPWEGGEGKVSAQYVSVLLQMAVHVREKSEYKKAEEYLMQALKPYPENLSEGRLYGTKENRVHFYLGCLYEKEGKLSLAKEQWELATQGSQTPGEVIYYNDQPPEMIYYQGLAYAKLGETKEAQLCYRNMIQYGKKHSFDEIKIDYFAVSLPDFLIFDDDLNQKNKIHCHYMMALGYLGLGQLDQYLEHAKMVLQMDCNHTGIYDNTPMFKH